MATETRTQRMRVGIFSIRNQILLAVAMAIIIPLTISTYVNAQNEQNSIENDLAEQLNLLAQAEAQTLELVLTDQLNLLGLLADIEELELFVRGSALRYDGTPEEILAEIEAIDEAWPQLPDSDIQVVSVLSNLATNNLEEFVENSSGHTEIVVTDIYGATLAATNRTTDYYQADEPWWQAAWNDGQGAIYISDRLEFDESIGAEVITMAVPITQDDVVIGVLRTNYTLEEIQGVVANTIVGETGRAKLMRHDGVVLASSDFASGDLVLTEIAATFEDSVSATKAELYRAVDETGEPVVTNSALITTEGEWPAIDALDWHVAFLQSEEEALAPVGIALRDSIVFEIIVLVLSLSIAYLASSVLTVPLGQLTQTAQEIATQRNWSKRVNIRGRSEFALLGQAFNRMAQEVQNSLLTLEERVAERTRDLQTVSDVSIQASTILQVDRLLQDVVDLTKERFALYHSHIYLYNPASNLLELVAGAGHVGRQMVAEKRTISIDNENSIVARAASTRRGQIVNDVSISPTFLPHPLLPDTQSELAVPLIARGELIGVLDIQSENVNAFTPEILGVMELLASQVSNSIANARLFEVADRTSRHETALGKIDRQIQQAASVDEILQVAIRELGKALRVPHAAIELQLIKEEEPQPAEAVIDATAANGAGTVAHVDAPMGYEEVTTG